MTFGETNDFCQRYRFGRLRKKVWNNFLLQWMYRVKIADFRWIWSLNVLCDPLLVLDRQYSSSHHLIKVFLLRRKNFPSNLANNFHLVPPVPYKSHVCIVTCVWFVPKNYQLDSFPDSGHPPSSLVPRSSNKEFPIK